MSIRFPLFTCLCFGFGFGLTACDQRPSHTAERAPAELPDGMSVPQSTQRPASPEQPQRDPMSPPRPDGPAAPPSDPTVAEFLGLRGPKPATWLWHPPQNSMIHTNYTVPARAGDDAKPAYVTVFFFGRGQGGDIELNIQRWQDQFRTAEGHAPDPIVTEFEVNDMPVTLVELEGEWRQMGAAGFTRDQLFLAAIIDAPVGRLFIRFAGPKPTVEANREAYMKLLRGLEVIEQ